MTEHSDVQALRDEIAVLHRRLDEMQESWSVRSLDVERLTVREEDGTPRAIIASRSAFPRRVQVAGTEIDHPRPVAGLLFFNDDGDECGGLVFAGDRKDRYQAGSLTFDRRDGDQVVQLSQDDGPIGRRAGLSVVDQPDVSLADLMPRYRRLQDMSERDRIEEVDQLRSEGLLPAARIFVGRSESGDALVVLHDGSGVPRLRLLVSEGGDTRIEGLDESGEVAWTFPPEDGEPGSTTKRPRP